MYRLFGVSGAFARKFPSYAPREPQQKLAQEVWNACQERPGLFAAEAPTGVGKSFALLAPALLRAAEQGERILVLTGSIPLQEQLISKDLPELMRILDIYLPYTLLKGRSRYACRLRAGELGKDGLLAFEEDEGKASSIILDWLKKTTLGDLEELPLSPGHPGVLRSAARSQGCLGRKCSEWEHCFVQQALRRAQDAQVVVANYHLFFAYTLGAKMAFPVPFDILICDEAHRLMEAARSAIAYSVSADEAARLFGIPVVKQLEVWAEKERMDGEALKEQVLSLGSGVRELFALLEWKGGKSRTFRRPLEEMLNYRGHFEERMARIGSIFIPFFHRFAGEEPSSEGEALSLWFDEVSSFVENMIWCCGVEDYPSWAYWWDGRALQSVPTECAPWISQVFDIDPGACVIASSATLAVEGSFAFWEKETGLTAGKKLVVDTPFSLQEQMQIWVVDMGLKVVDPSYDALFARTAERLVEDNGGRTLVLVSSRRLLRVVGDKLRAKPRSYRVLVQNELPRSELLKVFREDSTSVLVGTVSFREGVDVPGDGLTQVIIDRIPFPHPRDPLVEAQNDELGKKAFYQKTLPRAIMLLKQAVGRLIRSHEDRGRVVILDGRVIQRREWHILEALPRVRVRRLTLTGNIRNASE